MSTSTYTSFLKKNSKVIFCFLIAHFFNEKDNRFCSVSKTFLRSFLKKQEFLNFFREFEKVCLERGKLSKDSYKKGVYTAILIMYSKLLKIFEKG